MAFTCLSSQTAKLLNPAKIERLELGSLRTEASFHKPASVAETRFRGVDEKESTVSIRCRYSGMKDDNLGCNQAHQSWSIRLR